MIPNELKKLVDKHNLEKEEHFELRIKFGIECIERVKGFIVQDVILDALSTGEQFVRKECGLQELREAANKAAEAAGSHEGSKSLDGGGNAAVSVSHGVAAALDGRVFEASEYAAYASVYSYAAYAVTDLAAYAPEHSWQIDKLRALIASTMSSDVN